MEGSELAENKENGNNFHIGITMAGAISAGAYSAGVIDFLILALVEWEKAKKQNIDKNNDKSVPEHQVIIPVVSGASAGAIVGAIAFPLLCEGLSKTTYKNSQLGEFDYYLPKLFRAWVTLPNFTNSNGCGELFGLDDLAENSKVTSLLNSKVLDNIVTETFQTNLNGGTAQTYPFISEDLHLFFTHSNLRGVPYEIKMTGGNITQPGYSMTLHADRVHYCIYGIGTAQFSSRWLHYSDGQNQYPPDYSINLDVKGLGEIIEDDWQNFAEAVLGSSAFPVGLSARKINTPVIENYTDRSWPFNTATQGFKLSGMAGVCDDMSYVTVDGGLLNNEPFELARWTLMKNPPQPNARIENNNASEYSGIVDRAVITIDPFADSDKFAEHDSDTSLLNVILRILPAVKSNARFKASEAIALLDEDVYSRYLIAPRRYTNGKLEEYDIACGLLGGFGGFLDEKFRAFDYQLGRRNCYDFLQNHFALPQDFSVVKKGYKHVDKNQFIVGAKLQEYQINWLPIIPLVGGAKIQPKLLEWPKISNSELDITVKKASIRADKLFKKYLHEDVNNRLLKLAFRAFWFVIGQRKVKKYIKFTLYTDLIKRDQVESKADSHDRKILAALANPNYDTRNMCGLVKATGLDDADISNRLKNSLKNEINKYDLGGTSYSLKTKLNIWYKIPILKHIANYFVGIDTDNCNRN